MQPARSGGRNSRAGGSMPAWLLLAGAGTQPGCFRGKLMAALHDARRRALGEVRLAGAPREHEQARQAWWSKLRGSGVGRLQQTTVRRSGGGAEVSGQRLHLPGGVQQQPLGQRHRDDEVTFTWKDYRHGGRERLMTLSSDEFARRFPRGTSCRARLQCASAITVCSPTACCEDKLSASSAAPAARRGAEAEHCSGVRRAVASQGALSGVRARRDGSRRGTAPASVPGYASAGRQQPDSS